MQTMFSRRRFLRTSPLGGTAYLLLPRARLAFAYPANGKLAGLAGLWQRHRGRGSFEITVAWEYLLFAGQGRVLFNLEKVMHE